MDLLLNVPESSGPELEIARREMEAAEQAYLDAEKAEDEFGIMIPGDVLRRRGKARYRVAQLEAAEMQRRASL